MVTSDPEINCHFKQKQKGEIISFISCRTKVSYDFLYRLNTFCSFVIYM